MKRALLVVPLVVAAALAGCLAGDSEGAPADGGVDEETVSGPGDGSAVDPAGSADLNWTLPDDPYYDARAPGIEQPRTALDLGHNPGYHTFDEVMAKIDQIVESYPDLYEKQVIGQSVAGRDIVALASMGAPPNATALVADGGIHANEYEGMESAIFLADFLGHNQGHADVAAWFAEHQLVVVPLVNPDGYTVWKRYNDHRVDLNRNFDLDWCPDGVGCSDHPVNGNYAGSAPFSEPEAQAIRGLIDGLADRLGAYMTGHTHGHCVGGPWVAPNPPQPMPQEHIATYESYFAWIGGNTEFGASQYFEEGRSTCGGGMKGGLSFDWVYAEYGAFAVQVETGAPYSGSRSGACLVEFDGCWITGGPYRDLRGWVEATLPVYLMVLGNLEELDAWEAELGGPLVDVGEGS